MPAMNVTSQRLDRNAAAAAAARRSADDAGHGADDERLPPPPPSRRRRRRDLRSHVSLIALSAFAVTLCLALLSTALSSTSISSPRREATARSYTHASTASLSAIPKLADAATSLDHRDPHSFVSRILIPRVPGTPNMVKVQQMIKDVFEKDLAADRVKGRTGWHTEEHAFEARTPYGVKPFKNLIFTKNPHAPRKLVVSAHYDSKFFASGDFVAATDSAAPCAMMVDLAYALDALMDSDSQQTKDLTLQLIFFDGEEAWKVWTHTDSTYGSRALAANWSSSYFEPRRLTTAHVPMRKIDSIEHLVLLDLLGSMDPQVPSYFTTTDWLFQELISAEERLREGGHLYPPAALASGQRRRSFFRPGPATFGGIEDDHLPFLANGVPILHMIPTPFPAVWHTLKDDASALDWPTDYAWAMILRLFVAEYLGLDLGSATHAKGRGFSDGDADEYDDDGWGEDSWLRRPGVDRQQPPAVLNASEVVR